MKNSKRALILAIVAALVLCLGLIAGCSAKNTPTYDDNLTPALMPAQHQKYIDRPAYKCYKCHGASEKGNPSVAAAVALPEDHYVDNNPDTMQLVDLHMECRMCHSVDNSKQMDPEILEAAEVETGQEHLDGD